MKTLYFTFISIFFFSISSCKNYGEDTLSINGTWESVGCGWLLQIQDSTSYSIYDVTSISCLPNHKGPLNEIEKSLSLNGDTLSLLKGVITYRFVRADQLPELCDQKLSETKKNDPIYNYEVFAETVKEHYVFMDLNQVDWPTLYKKGESKLSENPTDLDLYLTIEETLKQLNDNHAYIGATDEIEEQVEEQEAPTEDSDLPEWGDFQVADKVVAHHLIENMTKDSWLINWGKLANDIGFIEVKAMWLYADLDIPDSLVDELGLVDAYIETFNKLYEGDYIEKEVEAVAQIMDKVMSDLSDMRSIVIDVRFNGGGQDAVSFEILKRFIPEKLPIAKQKLRYGNSFSPALQLYIQGSEPAFTKPVYILTSQQTASAAEAFAIASLSMQNAKRIGSATDGAMSTALEKHLPNGWAFSISNEVYMDNHGKAYENIGIPVDYDLHYPKDRQTFFRGVVDNLEADKQSILKAIHELGD